MGKIYNGEQKLNVVQVADILRNELTEKHAMVLHKHLHTDNNAKKAFAHTVLDAYKWLPAENEHDEKVKKYAKHLMEKYMKSSVTMEGEESVFRLLLQTIEEKGK